MKAIIFDTETTNTDDTAEIIEAAWIDLASDQEYCERFRPQGAISFGAMATHHIMLDDLSECQPSDNFNLPAVDYLIGHSIDFDWKMAGSPDVKRICTLALCRYLWPELDSHKQGAVMYFLFGADAQEQVKSAHCALDDVRMCRQILTACVRGLAQRGVSATTYHDIWKASEIARVPTIMSFGKHKGTAIKDVPADYKRWLRNQPDIDPYLLQAISI